MKTIGLACRFRSSSPPQSADLLRKELVSELQNLLSIHLGIFGRPSNGSVASDERLEHHKQTMPGGKQRPKKRHGRNSKTTVGKLR
ncbi:hypothetical protein MF410_36410 (plasmid) [Rhizobium sp. C104]|uniref:hypothetical protein n=1 Tax=Rhizobium sp. C104 TaxID=2917727 RepID=UPI001EF78D28|nr:hypothetical protein [Rhizobium sp. C104]ULJ82917.1 hypothetical protein MF410_36410 [Rhizobium sp. C104]